MDAEHFNHMEQGIHNNSLMLALLLENVKHTQQSVESVDGEELEVTLTNTKDFYFNNSVKTVALANMRSTLDYRVITEVQGNPVNVGDVVVYDKQVNGFKIAFTGSAKSVTVRCFVQGGGTVSWQISLFIVTKEKLKQTELFVIMVSIRNMQPKHKEIWLIA